MIVELRAENGLPVEVRHVGDHQITVRGYVWNDAGTEKRCPTEVCDAWCCKSGTLYRTEQPPCRFLSEHLSCSIQDKGGQSAKPYGCVIYPRSQADIDAMNKHAVGLRRCQLRIEAG